MKNILVIGGSKFTGKHLLRKLAKSKDLSITVINRGKELMEDFLPEGSQFIKADRSNSEEMRVALGGKDFDIVYDFYAITEEHIHNLLNVIGNVGRHVHVSSASVYPAFSDPMMQIPINEDTPFGPLTEDEHPYLLSKRKAELALMQAYKTEGYPVTIVRPTYIYGSDNYIYRDHYFFDRIDQERRIIVPGDGEVIIDLIHCDDLAELILLLGNAPAEQVVGEAFNGSSGYVISGNQYARIVGIILGKEAKIVNISHETLSKIDREDKLFFYPYSSQTPYALAMYKATTLLSFRPKNTYQSGLEDFHKWWLYNAKSKGREIDFTLEDKVLAFHDALSKSVNEDGYKVALESLQAYIDQLPQE